MSQHNFQTSEVKLGSGAYGSVYQAKDNPDQAVKIYVTSTDLELEYSVIREVSALTLLSGSDHVVKLYDVNIFDGQKILLERADNSLEHLIKSGQRQDETDVLDMIYQILVALVDLKNHNVAHRDLKPDNILYVRDDCTKYMLCDFGLAKHIQHNCYLLPSLTGTVQSLYYRAPEVMLNKGKYNLEKIDIWSLGLIVIELLAGFHIMTGKTEYEQLANLSKIFGTPNLKGTIYKGKILKYKRVDLQHFISHSLSQNTVLLIEAMTNVDENQRPLAEELLAKFFSFEPDILPVKDRDLQYELNEVVLKDHHLREATIGQIIDYFHKGHITRVTMFAAINYVDISICRAIICSSAKLLAIACISLAMKTYEIEFLSLETMANDLKLSYSAVAELEKRVFQTLGYKTFIRSYLYVNQFEEIETLLSNVTSLNSSYLSAMSPGAASSGKKVIS